MTAQRRHIPLATAALSAGLLLVGGILSAIAQQAEDRPDRARPSLREVLRQYPDADKNGDGRLDADERKALRRRLQGGGGEKPKAVSPKGVPATHANVKYGPHERNLLDIWLAKSDKPAPLVIFIHGGGFVAGDKSKAYGSKSVDAFLEAGVSFATISYRYRNTDPRGVRASLGDSKRALQFIRSQALEWNLDKLRIGAYGGSAGAGTSLWLGVHDDMAEPDSPDPVLRESTRLAVVGAQGTQATYDVMRWPELLKFEVAPTQLVEVLGFFGVETQDDLDSEEGKAIRADLDMLALMSEDDPPLYVRNGMEGGTPPKDRGHRNHHPLHATALKERAEEVGVEALVYAPAIGVEPPPDKQESLVEFFLRHLGVATSQQP
ncbi:MAG: alpha/beta hydrolase fold domain-containing protein [Armatimonadota bacterium]|jgi:acetyl esterase/lipase